VSPFLYSYTIYVRFNTWLRDLQYKFKFKIIIYNFKVFILL